jgi:hypothetical protein
MLFFMSFLFKFKYFCRRLNGKSGESALRISGFNGNVRHVKKAVPCCFVHEQEKLRNKKQSFKQ